MEVFFMIRRHKTTILLDTRENAKVIELKQMISNIIKRPPEDIKLQYERQILNDEDLLTSYMQAPARAQCPAIIGMMLRDTETGEFESLQITPYSEPPELPAVMDKDDESS